MYEKLDDAKQMAGTEGSDSRFQQIALKSPEKAKLLRSHRVN